MIKHYCDKCGEEIRGSYYAAKMSKDGDKVFRCVDLCESCYHGMTAWIHDRQPCNDLAANEICDIVAKEHPELVGRIYKIMRKHGIIRMI